MHRCRTPGVCRAFPSRMRRGLCISRSDPRSSSSGAADSERPGLPVIASNKKGSTRTQSLRVGGALAKVRARHANETASERRSDKIKPAATAGRPTRGDQPPSGPKCGRMIPPRDCSGTVQGQMTQVWFRRPAQCCTVLVACSVLKLVWCLGGPGTADHHIPRKLGRILPCSWTDGTPTCRLSPALLMSCEHASG